jgi:F-box associated protein
MPSSGLPDLPPELILRILSQLALRPLLDFSLVSNNCHALSRLSMRRLSFGIFPTRLSSHISRLSTSTTLRDIVHGRPDRFIIAEENCVTLVIPEADILDIATQVCFHDALNRAVLDRYANGLRVLDLSVWRMERGIARALSGLMGLQSLTLKIENPFFRRRVSRTDDSLLQEQRGVWSLLAGAWTRLRVLRLEGVSATAEELLDTISGNDDIEELWLTRCDRLAGEVLGMLDQWEVCPRLKYLGVVESPATVKVEDLDFLQHFKTLEVCPR